MRTTQIAFACALLGASALIPVAALAQADSPSTMAPSSPSETDTSPAPRSNPADTSGMNGGGGGPSDVQDGGPRASRSGAWRSGRNDDASSRSRGPDGDSSADDPHRDVPGYGWHRRMMDEAERGGGWMGGRGMPTAGRFGYDGDGDRGGPDWRGRMMGDHHGMMGGRMMGRGGMAFGMGGRGHGHMRPGMGHGGRGARLDFKRGDSSMRIRCPADESIAACVDAVTKLMDKLQSVHQTPAQ